MLSFIFIFIIPFFLIFILLFSGKYKDKLLDNYLFFIINNILKVKYKKLNNNKLINKGFIISNHPSIYDIFHDTYYTKSIPISHNLVLKKIPFAILLIIICNRIFIFNRDKKNIDKNELFKNIKCKLNNSKKEYSRCLLYPEGKLIQYNEGIKNIEHLKNNLKFGLLKKIYEDNEYPVQLFITSYKEKVINQFTSEINFNQKIYSKISKPIYPKDYKTFEDFCNAIVKKWYKYYLDTNI